MRVLKWVLIVVAGLLALLPLVCLEEDWRSQKAWEQSKSQLETQGEKLDWKDFIPPPVPDNKNFFNAPKMQEWFQENSNPYVHKHTELWGLSTNESTTASITNLDQAKNYLAWSDQFSPQFNLIQAALERPYARMVGDYSAPLRMPEPYFAHFRDVSRTFALRAKADLVIGKPDEAIKELTFLDQVRNLMQFPPSNKPVTEIIAMMEGVFADLEATTITEGLQTHKWNEQQLASLQRQLQRINLLQRQMDVMRFEFAWNSYLFKTNLISVLPARHHMLRAALFRNIVTITKFDQQVVDSIDVSNNVINPAALDELERQRKVIEKPYFLPFNSTAIFGIPIFTERWQVIAYDQTLINETQIACALERFRLAHGDCPETLAELSPQLIGTIPHDIIGGQPLHYRRTADGKFLLYSIGWNEKDDGGMPSPHDANGGIDYTNGDWVQPDR